MPTKESFQLLESFVGVHLELFFEDYSNVKDTECREVPSSFTRKKKQDRKEEKTERREEQLNEQSLIAGLALVKNDFSYFAKGMSIVFIGEFMVF